MGTSSSGSPVGRGQKDAAAGPVKAAIYRLAYDEGKRAVDEQLAELDAIRQRTVQFLAFVGAATAFLVGAGLDGPSRPPLFYVIAVTATLLAVVCMIICRAILITSKHLLALDVDSWSARLSPGKLKAWAEGELLPSEASLYASLADTYESMVGHNRPLLRKMRKRYGMFLLIGFSQLVLWVLLTWMFA